jgi:hypothetical protein
MWGSYVVYQLIELRISHRPGDRSLTDLFEMSLEENSQTMEAPWEDLSWKPDRIESHYSQLMRT